MRKFIKPVGTKPGVMYGNCKVHKQQVDGCPPFWPILSTLKTPTYNIAKFLVLILNPFTKDEYIVKDSFQLADEICGQDLHYPWVVWILNHFLIAFLLMKLLNICVNQLIDNADTVEGFTKSELKHLLCLEPYFIFNGLL